MCLEEYLDKILHSRNSLIIMIISYIIFCSQLSMVMHHGELERSVKRLFCYHHSQRHIEGL